ncbi:MAG TPA: hypothetical protein VF899_03810 [Pyrinomonadaceae bacterium]
MTANSSWFDLAGFIGGLSACFLRDTSSNIADISAQAIENLTLQSRLLSNH